MIHIGFIGTGAITEAVVTGLATLPEPPRKITISPRNAERAAYLAERFPNVTVAPDNQGVLDASDIVCLAIRPQVTEAVLTPLTFSSEHIVVSLVSTFSTDTLAALTAPARRIHRMVPLPPVARHEGPVLLTPPADDLIRIFGSIGTLIAVDDESLLKSFAAVTALMAPYFAMLESVTGWLTGRGISEHDAACFAGTMFAAIARTGEREARKGFALLRTEHATPEGINEQAARELVRTGWTGQIEDVLDLIADRIEGRADFDSRLR